MDRTGEGHGGNSGGLWGWGGGRGASDGGRRKSLLYRLFGRFAGIRRTHLAVTVALGVIAIFILIGASWLYTNDSDFCGLRCHTMRPYYTAYANSSHARVPCVSCHLGIGFSFGTVVRKSYDGRDLVSEALKLYSLPIKAESLRPARETCEKCHWTQAFYFDQVKIITHFGNDPANTPEKTVLALSIGGGLAREGLGYGIHWHVQNPVTFIAQGPDSQVIPWVSATINGKQVVYKDPTAGLTDKDIAAAKKKTMDCIDCHNVVTHGFASPETVVDTVLTQKLADARLPSFRAKAVSAISANLGDSVKMNAALDALANSYANDPALPADVKKAAGPSVKAVKDYATKSAFPQAKIIWSTYPNNVGHKDFPGCFRCHDGRHVTSDAGVPPERKVIRLHCNICHNIPIAATGTRTPAPVPVVRAAQPASHLAATWMADHRVRATSAECQSCHTVSPTDPNSFCANSKCHATQWQYAKVLPAIPHRGACTTCHTSTAPPTAATCRNCHTSLPGLHRAGGDEREGGDEGGAGGEGHSQVACQTCHTAHSWAVQPRGACESCHKDRTGHHPGTPCAGCHSFRGT